MRRCVFKRKDLPKTLTDKGYIDEVNRSFYRRNHAAKLFDFEDYDNLSLKAKTNASSTLDDWSVIGEEIDQFILTSRCQFQFPVTSDLIENLSVNLQAKDQQVFTVKLFEGSGYNHSNPEFVCTRKLLFVKENLTN